MKKTRTQKYQDFIDKYNRKNDVHIHKRKFKVGSKKRYAIIDDNDNIMAWAEHDRDLAIMLFLEKDTRFDEDEMYWHKNVNIAYQYNPRFLNYLMENKRKNQ